MKRSWLMTRNDVVAYGTSPGCKGRHKEAEAGKFESGPYPSITVWPFPTKIIQETAKE